MVQYQLLGKTYQIPKTSKDFLDSYIKRLENYIKTHHISETYLDDILERINDKLTQLESDSEIIQNTDIIKIVNDIGEAEDIFPKESHTNTEISHPNQVWQKGLKRDTSNAILFGVCAGIARHFAVDPLWIRILFIVFTFTGGAGILIYIFLIFLIPSDIVKNKNNTEKSSGILDSIGSAAGTGLSGIVKLIFMLILLTIGCTLIGFFIAGVIASGILISGEFQMGNQIFLNNIPDSLLIAVPLLTVLVAIATFDIFANIVGKTILGKKGWLSIAIMTAIGFILLVSGIIGTAKEYSWIENKSSESEITFTGKTLHIENNLRGYGRGNNILNGSIDFVNIEYSDSMSNKIKIRTTENFYTKNEETANIILSNKNPISYSLSGNTLTLTKNSKGDFSNVVPFSFFNREITIVLPQNIELEESYHQYDYARNYREHKKNQMVPPEDIEFITE